MREGGRWVGGWLDSVKEAGFGHDAKLGGVNLLWTCVESCDTHKQHQLLQEASLWALTVTKGYLYLLGFRKKKKLNIWV